MYPAAMKARIAPIRRRDAAPSRWQSSAAICQISTSAGSRPAPLGGAAPQAASGRLIRLIDATTAPQAGWAARLKNGLWRVHSAFELPAERFGFFEVTDEQEGERFDRIPVVKGEIRIADRAYMQPHRIARVLAAGGDILVRTGWKGARWLDADDNPFDLVALFGNTPHDLIDRPIWVRCRGACPLRLRLVALRKSATAAEAARRKARREAQKGGHQIAEETLAAADWVIVITSLAPEDFPTADILALYRLRWHRTRLQTVEKSGWPARPAGCRRALRQTLRAGSPFDDPLTRAARRRARGPSPLGRRLTRPGTWRWLRQLTTTLLQAIIPQPTIASLRTAKDRVRRHLHEPPRRRTYQNMTLS
jgi:hypothetical protein